MLKRLMNLPLSVASRAAKAFQDREDARLKEKYGTAEDPAAVPDARGHAGPEIGPVALQGLTVRAEAVRAALAAGRPVAFVDVREAGAAGGIEGAVHMPVASINVRVSELPWDRMVVAFCEDGSRAAQAVAFFRERGMEDTFALAGGLGAWRASEPA